MKPIFFLFAGALAFSACNKNAEVAENASLAATETTENASENNLKTIGSAEAKALLEKQKNVVVLDVRTPEEFAGGHVKNAQLLNKYDPEFETKIQALDKEKTYLVYCKIGGRSGEATRLMQRLGFKQIYDATEGFISLKSAGLPVE